MDISEIQEMDDKELLEEYKDLCREDGGQYIIDFEKLKAIEKEILNRMKQLRRW